MTKQIISIEALSTDTVAKLAAVLESSNPRDVSALTVVETLSRLRPYTLGKFFVKALHHGYFPSARKMAEEIGCESLTTFSKYIDLAKLPAQIVAAFGTGDSIRLAWSGPLMYKLMMRDPDLALCRGNEIAARRAAGEKLSAMDVYKSLMAGL